MKGDIYERFAGFVTCASISRQSTHERPALVSIPVGTPFECIGIDFVEMDRSMQRWEPVCTCCIGLPYQMSRGVCLTGQEGQKSC